MTRKISEGILTFGFIGRLPGIPGTWGSAAAITVCFFIPASWNFAVVVLVAAASLFLLGVILSADAQRDFGSSDPSSIVLDEVVGMLLSVGIHPRPTLATLVLAFVLFRFFDIVKPVPVRTAERLPRGLGIFMDDVVAGLYTNAILRLVLLVV